MSVKLNPTSVIKARLGIDPTGPVQKFFTHTCAIHMDKYVPYDTGTLATTLQEDTNKVVYIQPYAEIMYYGVRNGKDINYHTDIHELAGPFWDKRMWSAERKIVTREVQDYFNKFGGR